VRWAKGGLGHGCFAGTSVCTLVPVNPVVPADPVEVELAPLTELVVGAPCAMATVKSDRALPPAQEEAKAEGRVGENEADWMGGESPFGVALDN
jgi:hypothetical protein